MTGRSELIFQRDGTLLVTPGEGRQQIVEIIRQCAQLRTISAGNYIYELSPATLWGAAARGLSAGDLLAALDRVATMPVPSAVAARIAETFARYGALIIERDGDALLLSARDPHLLSRLGLVSDEAPSSRTVRIEARDIGRIKIQAARAGWPVVDHRMDVQPGGQSPWRLSLVLRPYQCAAVEAFVKAGSGVILLPCGAGKTAIGVAAAATVPGPILVLVPSRLVAEQWRGMFVDHTTIDPLHVSVIGSGTSIGPITIATYHAATLGIEAGNLLGHSWSLVIYDEVQSLPADSFRLAAAMQTSRRLGLTATLVREDGREREIAALVGPPLYDASWLELERDGWIAPVRCVEVRLPSHEASQERVRYKLAIIERLLNQHSNEQVLVMGTDMASLRAAGRRLSFPVLTGGTSVDQRQCALQAFRDGTVRVLGLSKIGTTGIDLPDASVLIQMSGTFGSRQEEAQRLGRLLRPRPGKTGHFYTLVSSSTNEIRYAERRQRFLVNRGYIYEIVDAAEIPRAFKTFT